MRGAGSGCLDRVERRVEFEKPFARVSSLREFCGGGISGGCSMAGGSPSKNLAIAILPLLSAYLNVVTL